MADDPASLEEPPRSFLLGDQLLVAPVLEEGADTLEVALPAGRWVHLWSQREFVARAGGRVKVAAPPGQPAVFYPVGSLVGEELRRALDVRGLLTSPVSAE